MTNESPSSGEDLQFLKYDRQIRIWGIEAQRRISSSKILVIGALSPTGTEVIKNLVLTGIAQLYILKEDNVSCDNQRRSFFLNAMPIDDFMDPYEYFVDQIRSLNPTIHISLITDYGELSVVVDCMVHCNRFVSDVTDDPNGHYYEFSQVC